jgi:D-sedoheptulose 7-phosphate isomerase
LWNLRKNNLSGTRTVTTSIFFLGRWFALELCPVVVILKFVRDWILDYIRQQKAALDSIPIEGVEEIISAFRDALKNDRQIFIFGNGGSAANSSHFITDLGKGASDKLGSRFRCLALNDNISWITALGNDYSYDDVFVRQLQNFARPGDIVMTLSVSGSSPNLVKAIDWAVNNGMYTIALVGAKRGKLAQIAQKVVVINSEHYGRVEDAHMGICHMICYAFMENPALAA